MSVYYHKAVKIAHHSKIFATSIVLNWIILQLAAWINSQEVSLLLFPKACFSTCYDTYYKNFIHDCHNVIFNLNYFS